MKLGYVSDLHLDSANMPALINPEWEALAILGDTAVDFSLLDEFLYYKVPKDIPILYVPGNHEFENKEYHQALDQLQHLINQYPNIHLLHNKAITIGNCKFIGSTLWTDFNLHSTPTLSKEWAQKHIHDFQSIAFNNQPITPNIMAKLFEDAYQFLKFEIKEPNATPCHRIVLTHFAPHIQSQSPKFAHTDSAYFISDLSEFTGLVDVWIHGHIHHSVHYTLDETTYLANPRGNGQQYALHGNPNFNPTATLVLP